MPMPDRTFRALTTSGHTDLPRTLAVLLDPALADVVGLVAWRAGPEQVMVANAFGCSRITADGHEPVHGQDPIARQDPLAFAGRDLELADPHPSAERNHYPLAAARLLAAFADPDRAPDVIVMHTDAHFWPERGGHLGEHGSLSVLQSRAPWLQSGAGVTQRGMLPTHARIVDVAPTLLHLAGLPVPAGLDGRPRTEFASAGAQHVIGLLWDGANSSALLAGATDGTLPNVGRLLAAGFALTGGAVAEFPSVTLTNHASALTGLSPGRHGIVHNAFYDRHLQRQVLANDASTWHTACDLLRPAARTLWELAGDHGSACVNEPIDRGAGYSTFALVRASGADDGARSLRGSLAPASEDPHADQGWVGKDGDYAWSTQVDAMGLAQMMTLFDADAPPRLAWWNTTLTDTGHHGGGAHSAEATAALIDSDRRLGVFLDLLERRDLLRHSVFLLTADHGSVAAEPACRGDWGEALAAAGLAVRDEAYGYL
ncbi:MAG TPA: alkaline phosphatase family protein, partial [Mycobacteriales bacterium]|nr:alkaline phosphatase family protein [Mycobacteriales bacterium]